MPKLAQAFECFGTTTPGTTPGPYYAESYPSYCGVNGSFGEKDGNTLAQVEANVDVQFVALGSNDLALPLGALGDATSSGTFYGNMRWIVETILTAKPTVRLIFITPEYNQFATPTVIQQYVAAEVAYCESVGVPVVNMFKLSGINTITASSLTVDGTHLNSYAYINLYGPVVAQAAQNLY